MEQSVDVPDRGLRRNAVGLPALVAQSLGVTAPEISAVVIAAVVASKVGGATPFAFIVAGIGALGLALIYGRFARYVPHAGGTYAIVRAGLGRDTGSSRAGPCLRSASSSSRRCSWRRRSSCRTFSGSCRRTPRPCCTTAGSSGQ